MTRPSDTKAVTLPTTPGSVIEAKPRGRKKAFLMALCDDGACDPPCYQCKNLFATVESILAARLAGKDDER